MNDRAPSLRSVLLALLALALALPATGCAGLFAGQRGGRARVTWKELELPPRELEPAVSGSGWYQGQMSCTITPEPWPLKKESIRADGRRRYWSKEEVLDRLAKARKSYSPGVLYARIRVKTRNETTANEAWTFVLVDQGGEIHRANAVERVEPEATVDGLFWTRRVRVAFRGLATGDLTPRTEIRCIPPTAGVQEMKVRWTVDREGARWLIGEVQDSKSI